MLNGDGTDSMIERVASTAVTPVLEYLAGVDAESTVRLSISLSNCRNRAAIAVEILTYM